MSSLQPNLHIYKLKKTKTINILLVGRSGTGKSTLLERITNANFKVASTTGYSVTKEAFFYPYILHDETQNIYYQLNVLDTPGLNEHRVRKEKNRSNDVLLDLALRCIQNNVTFLNVVCFITRAGDTYEHDVAVFQKLKKFLGDKFGSITMIILTHSEQLPGKRIDEYISQLKSHDDTKPLVEYCKLGIFNSGTINTDYLEDLPDEAKDMVEKTQQEKIASMRNTLMKTFISCADKQQKSSEIDELQKKHRKELEDHVRKEKDKCNIL